MSLFIKQQGKGQPLILLHGFAFNSEIWNPLAAQLAESWHVYQIDLPGHGRSSMSEYRLSLLVQTLAAHLPQQAIWIGWSLGGLLAMAMARWQPTWVRALILVGSSPRFTTAKDWPYAITPAVLKQFGQQLQQDTIGTLQRFLALQVKGSESAHQQLRTLNTLLKNSGLPQPEALQAGLHLLQTADLRSELQYIHSPSLLCLGRLDTVVPVAMGTECQKWWPQLHQEVIQSAGHIPFLSHPKIFNGILDRFFTEILD